MMMTSYFPSVYSDPRMGMNRKTRFTREQGMQCDVREFDDRYELDIELPGYKKENIHAEVNKGYLTVHAERKTLHEDKEDGHVIQSERFIGECRRSFYVGEHVTRENVKAAYQDGILKLTVPKKSAVQAPETRFIDIL